MPKGTKLLLERDRSIAGVIGAAAIAVGVTYYVLTVWSPGVGGLQVVVGVVLLISAVAFDARFNGLPAVIRPAFVAVIALLISSVSSAVLTDPNDFSDYLGLWTAQLFGTAAGVATGWLALSQVPSRAKRLDADALDRFALLAFVACLIAAFLFFAAAGIPVLSRDIEQARVDVAASGTGYFRLLAYMAAPASILLVVTRGRSGYIFVAIAAVLIVCLANRSPLLYLLVPLGCVFVVARERLGSAAIIAVAVGLAVAVAGLGTYRIVSQSEFRQYAEYRDALATNNYVSVAATSVLHYAEIIPENALLVKRLVDDGALPYQRGQTYATLFLAALPGQQLSPDLLIKEASGKRFVGGGTPPTLSGEGYMNGGYIGVALSGFALVFLLQFWARNATRNLRATVAEQRMNTAIYGYVVVWAVLAQVAGFAGASTVPLAGFLFLVCGRQVSMRYRHD